VFLQRLSLTNFRNHADALLRLGPGFVVLTGENGAGKTNVLEAISLLSPGRGLRGVALSAMARNDGPGGFAVAARLDTGDAASGAAQGTGTGAGTGIDIGTGTSAGAPERRQVRINGSTASATSLGEWLSILWLTPAMDRLFSETASGRRRFLDRLVLALDPGHATHSARYEAAMRARNKLLADPGGLGGSGGADPSWLAALEAAMAEHGARIAAAREHTLAALAARLDAQPEGPFARAAVKLERWRPAADDAEGALRAALRANRGADAGAGRALIGPHRSDLRVTHVGKGQPAEHCSTGEQKALLLAIVLAHADLVAERTARPPILLLDEVAAHLDPRRRAALFERLEALRGQVWLTGTERALFDGIAGATWLDLNGAALDPGRAES
jgi:DNA replication and repair protein RecF